MRVAVPKHLRGIDVARCIAALAVVLSHLRVGNLPAAGSHGLAWYVASLQLVLGAWGVGLFFVISGFCVHLPMARRRAEGENPQLRLSGYFRRRFLRIYPPHLVALILCTALGLLLPDKILDSGTSLITRPTAIQFAAHALLIHSFWSSTISTISPVFWTIAVETHFYLLYPLWLKARARYGLRIAVVVPLLLSLVARSVVLRYFPHETSVVESNFICRFWEWALGCACAEMLFHGRFRGRSLSLTIGSYGISFLFPFALQIGLQHLFGAETGRTLSSEIRSMTWPWMFGLLVMFSARQYERAPELLARVAAASGRESYSLYLTHPFAMTLVVWAGANLSFAAMLQPSLTLAAALVFAAVFFRIVERPFWMLAQRERIAPAPILAKR